MGLFGAWLWRNAIRKGVLGGSRVWMIVAIVGGARRLMKRLNSGNDEERLGITLQPGERLELAVIEPERRGRGRR